LGRIKKRLEMGKVRDILFPPNGEDKLEMWWDDLWMSDEEKAEIKESLRKRRESGGCSMWRTYLKEHPEAAKHDWEKEFVKNNK